MEPKEPKSVHAMTADERKALLRRRDVRRSGDGIDIGGDTATRRALRVGGRLLTLLAVAALFVVLFFRFTASWRVAMVVVGLMLAYMTAIGRVVEGRAGRSE